jgi:hypothetical protein
MTPWFAWPTFVEPWVCEVTKLLLDGKEADAAVNRDHLTIACHEQPWEEAQISVLISTEQATPGGLDELSAHVVVTCRGTQLRLARPMTKCQDGSGFETTLSVPRSILSGKADIAAQISSEVGGRRRIVGSTLAWSLTVDKSEAPERAGSAPIKTTWVDFGGSGAPQEARRNPSAYCHLDINQDPPMLFLNSAIDGFQSLIQAENAKLERRRHRDLIGSMIAKQVANSLIRAAVDEISPGDYGAPTIGPTGPLLREMCEALSKHLPDTDSVEDFYELVADLHGNSVAAARFWSDVDLALDRMTSLADTVSTICKEVKHV